MSQSLAQVYLHLVFSTNNRATLLENEQLRNETHHYLMGICRNLDSPSLVVGGSTDHVHILCSLSRDLKIKDLLQELKRDSSRWINSKGIPMPHFHWQNGYGAFSVSPSHIPVLRHYIEHQMEHHQTESFQDEFRRLLRKYDVPYDERYVWD